MAKAQTEAYRSAISTFIRILDTPPPQADAFSVADVPRIGGRDNFALQTFFLQKLYVEENLPVVASLWRQVLHRTGSRLGMTFDDAASPPRAAATSIGLYCTAHIQAYLMCLVDLVRLATTDDSVRRIYADASCLRVETGLNFMRRAEQFALSGLARLGQSRYVAMINDESTGFGPLVQGLFIEQYHVTQRFVEIIAPLMTKRTRSPIATFRRSLGTRPSNTLHAWHSALRPRNSMRHCRYRFFRPTSTHSPSLAVTTRLVT